MQKEIEYFKLQEKQTQIGFKKDDIIKVQKQSEYKDDDYIFTVHGDIVEFKNIKIQNDILGKVTELRRDCSQF